MPAHLLDIEIGLSKCLLPIRETKNNFYWRRYTLIESFAGWQLTFYNVSRLTKQSTKGVQPIDLDTTHIC